MENFINYKYKSHKLDSTLNKIINSKKPNIILDVVYRHPTIDLNEFNYKYLDKLLDNISKEKKITFITGHFKIDLLKYDNHTPNK